MVEYFTAQPSAQFPPPFLLGCLPLALGGRPHSLPRCQKNFRPIVFKQFKLNKSFTHPATKTAKESVLGVHYPVVIILRRSGRETAQQQNSIAEMHRRRRILEDLFEFSASFLECFLGPFCTRSGKQEIIGKQLLFHGNGF